MVFLSSLDNKIWKYFNFSNENFWIPMSIPVTIFVIVSIVLFVRDYKKAKKEEREIKKWIKILFIVGIVVGSIEALILLQVLILLIWYFPKTIMVLFGVLLILSVVSIVRFVKESKIAKLEERPVKTSILVMFLIAVVVSCIIVSMFLKALF